MRTEKRPAYQIEPEVPKTWGELFEAKERAGVSDRGKELKRVIEHAKTIGDKTLLENALKEYEVYKKEFKFKCEIDEWLEKWEKQSKVPGLSELVGDILGTLKYKGTQIEVIRDIAKDLIEFVSKLPPERGKIIAEMAIELIKICGDEAERQIERRDKNKERINFEKGKIIGTVETSIGILMNI